jgi:hypothetical protein
MTRWASLCLLSVAGAVRAQPSAAGAAMVRVASLCLLCLLPVAGAVRAQPSAAGKHVVWLSERPCVPARYAPGALFQLLEIELMPIGVGLTRPPAADGGTEAPLVVVTVSCDGTPDSIQLTLDDLASRTHSERSLLMTDVPMQARARTLALAIAAAVEQSLAQALAPQPDAQTVLAPEIAAALRMRLQLKLGPALPPPPPAAKPAPSYALDLAAQLRMFPSYSTGLMGVNAGVSRAFAPPLRARLAAEALLGQSELNDALGTVGRMNMYWLAVQASLAWRSRTEPELSAGPAISLGYGWATGHAERADAIASSDSRVVLCLLATASLRAAVDERLALLLGVDIGYTPVGITFLGDQSSLAGMAGVTVGLHIGVSI